MRFNLLARVILSYPGSYECVTVRIRNWVVDHTIVVLRLLLISEERPGLDQQAVKSVNRWYLLNQLHTTIVKSAFSESILDILLEPFQHYISSSDLDHSWEPNDG